MSTTTTTTMLHRLSLALAFLTLSSSVIALSIPHDDSHHDFSRRALPGAWYQSDDHPVHALFKRDVTGDGVTYAQVGSSEWKAGFPTGKADPSKLPKAWVDALNAAVAAGKIPNIPVSTYQSNGMPTYGGLDPNGAQVCSTTYQCEKNPNVIWNAPNGTVGISFDDGPIPGSSDTLYAFLKQNNVRATHFFIGENIRDNPKEFLAAFQDNEDDIAVHTWTHPYMTTLSNEDVLGELGWTMQIIHNSTGGRIPKYWRPPYGDSDNRVVAIASEVFGMKTVVWNHDTDDWSIGESGGATPQSVHANLQKWYTGPKNPGLIILEHELTSATVQAFIDAFPILSGNGWKILSVAELDGGAPYQNADSDEGTVVPVNGIIYNGTAPSPTSSASSSAGSTSSSSDSTSSMHTTITSTASSTATNSIVTSAGTSSVNGTTAVGDGQGSKQVSLTSQAPGATGSAGSKQQQSGASSFVQMAFWDVRGVFAAFVTIFVSAFALA